MFKSYLKIALRNLLKNKTYSIINIFSMAVGLGAFILIALYVQYEEDWDKFNKNFRSIYRVEKIAHFPNGDQRWENTQFPLGPALFNNYPEIINFTRVRNAWGQFISSQKDKTFYEKDGYFVDNNIFKIFTFHFLSGSPESALIDPGSIVLTEKLARKLFPNTNPIDKVICLENKYDCKVTAVIKDPPLNSHFKFNYFLPIGAHKIMRWNAANQWSDHILYTYVVLKKDVSPKVVSNKIAAFDHKFEPDNKDHQLYLKPLSELHLNPDSNTNLSIIIYLFSAMGLFALILGCVNYVNLSTACAANRAKEIGIKKTVGASKHILIFQFLSESILISGIAFIISMTISELVLPVFNQIVDRSLALNFISGWRFILFMFLTSIFTGIISGIYPAFYLSSFSPAAVIKQFSTSPKNKYLLRKALVVFQFFISIMLTIATIIIYDQINYMKDKDLGFDPNNILIIDTKKYGKIDNSKYNTFKNDILKNPNILHTSFSNTIPFYSVNNTTISWEGSNADEKLWCEYNKIDFDFINTYNLNIKEGRNFKYNLSTEDNNACILNETAVKCIGWKEPVGKRIHFWDRKLKVIGIVKDFHSSSLHNEIMPYIMIPALDEGIDNLFSFRIDQHDQQETVQYILHNFSKFFPDDLYIHQFLTDNMDQITFNILNGVIKTFGFFALLSILIASFGLFGLVSFSAHQRTKEIGIRKVLGASVSQMFMMLLKSFLKLFLIANVIAWIFGFIVMNILLQEFAYRADIKFSVFLLASSLGFIILISTVFFKVIKTAGANPVEALRYE